MSAYQVLPGTGEINLSHVSKTLKDMSTLVKNLKSSRGLAYQSTLESIKRLENDLVDIFENGKPSKDQKHQFQSLSKQFEDLRKVLNTLEEAYARRTVRESIYESTGLVQYDELAFKNEEELDNQILQEKHQAAEEIHKDILKLNEMFKDVAGMVNEQGQDLNRVDGNLDVAVKSTDKANNELVSAQEYQSSARRKACYLILVLLVAVLFFVGWFFLPKSIKRLLKSLGI